MHPWHVRYMINEDNEIFVGLDTARDLASIYEATEIVEQLDLLGIEIASAYAGELLKGERD